MINKYLFNSKVWIPPVAAFFLGVASVNGQTSKPKKDTLREKEIDEVVVVGLWKGKKK